MTPPDPQQYRTAVGYGEALKEQGWSRTGGGAGGSIYHRVGGPQIIKVTDGDDCYLAFANYAENNPLSCLPLLKIVYRGSGWGVIHIEHLSQLSSEKADEVRKWWEEYVSSKKANSPSPSPQVWSDLMDDIWLIAKSHRCGFDFKAENVMQRSRTGEVVFVDLLF
ncbi:hypothetical protein [Methylorubrum extorquens]